MRFRLQHALFLLLICCLSLATGFRAQAAPVCQSLFIDTVPAPSRFLIDLNGMTATPILKRAFKDVIDGTDLDSARRILKKIVNQGPDSLSNKEIQQLKDIRKLTTTLRSTLQIATVDHAAPKDFESFVKDLGHLNDQLASRTSSKTEELADEIRDEAANLDFQKMLDQVQPASPESIKEYYLSIIEEARALMARDKVALAEYHEVRKILKEFMNYYLMANRIRKGQFHDQFNYLTKLNDALGEVNDGFTAEILKGKASKNKTMIKFPSKLRPKVMLFLSEVQIQQDQQNQTNQGN